MCPSPEAVISVVEVGLLGRAETGSAIGFRIGTKCHGCWRDTGKYACPKSAAYGLWQPSGGMRHLRAGIFARGPRAAWHFNIIPWEIRFPN